MYFNKSHSGITVIILGNFSISFNAFVRQLTNLAGADFWFVGLEV